MGRYIVGITGASGVQYTQRLLNVLLSGGHSVECVVSSSAKRVLEIESDLVLVDSPAKDKELIINWAGVSRDAKLTLYARDDVAAPIASGSFAVDGMAVIPCSGSSLGKIASGISAGLIERAAEVSLKEKRKLILVPRETPVSLVYLRNLVSVSEAGAIILPASPGFYHKPKQIGNLIDMVVSRVISQFGLSSKILQPWRGHGSSYRPEEE